MPLMQAHRYTHSTSICSLHQNMYMLRQKSLRTLRKTYIIIFVVYIITQRPLCCLYIRLVSKFLHSLLNLLFFFLRMFITQRFFSGSHATSSQVVVFFMMLILSYIVKELAVIEVDLIYYYSYTTYFTHFPSRHQH